MAPVDPVTLEVVGNYLVSAVREMGTALMRTAYSTLIREEMDCSTALFVTSSADSRRRHGGGASLQGHEPDHRGRRRDQHGDRGGRGLRAAGRARPGAGAPDVLDGKVSVAQAREVYRVLVDLAQGRLDAEATAALRAVSPPRGGG
jgi:hypothetical protein